MPPWPSVTRWTTSSSDGLASSRFGPTVPDAFASDSVWQAAQPALAKTSLPAVGSPFSARAGVDLNADGANTDYVPGTHKGQGNRDLDIGLVNAWRASRALGPINPAQISKNDYNRVDVRVSKAFNLGTRRRLEGIFQVFNLFGRDNLGGIGSSFQTNALSDSFGQLLTAQNRQQSEIAVRLTF